jgi:hypothetical protein
MLAAALSPAPTRCPVQRKWYVSHSASHNSMSLLFPQVTHWEILTVLWLYCDFTITGLLPSNILSVTVLTGTVSDVAKLRKNWYRYSESCHCCVIQKFWSTKNTVDPDFC